MAARAAAFSDPEVKAVLEGHFVPIAENCSYLQRQQDAEGDLFRLIAEQGHYGGRFQPTDTRQGMYVCAPDGALLASCNVHGADRLLPVLRGALERWGARGDRVAAPPTGEGATDARFLRNAPEDGLVLRVWARDLPREGVPVSPGDGQWRRRAFNLDHAWFRREEAAALLPAAGTAAVWPQSLARRLVRYHLIDNVRGETPMWRPEEVQVATVRTRMTNAAGDRVELSFEGEAAMVHRGAWVDDFSRERHESEHRIEVRIDGSAEWSTDLGRFVRFDLAATGTRWGATQYNSRGGDPGPAPIGFALELAAAPAMAGDTTPPQGIGADYFGGR